MSDIKLTFTPEYFSAYIIKDNQMIGSSEVSIIKDNLGFYSRLYVKPQYRNQGYGRQLWEFTEQVLDEHNIELQIPINPYGDMDYNQLKEFYSSDQTEETEYGLLRRTKNENSK